MNTYVHGARVGVLRKQWSLDNRRYFYWSWLMAVLILLSSIAVVVVKDANRQLMIVEQDLQSQQGMLAVDRGRLMLAKSRWLVSLQARAKQAGMMMPSSSRIKLVHLDIE